MTRQIFSTVLTGLLLVLLLASCGSYRQNIMFTVPEGTALMNEIQAAEKNYVIQNSDFLSMEVFTSGGERIIDPDFQLMKDLPVQNANAVKPTTTYLINTNGEAKLPMIGVVKLEGLTLQEAEQFLQQEYTKFYQDPFVILKYENKRVIVLGAPAGQVIPLVNQNVTLVEVLALAHGVGNDAKAHNIRVIRSDQVFVADFSTFDGFKKSNLIMEPGDVVYIEPIRRPIAESVRDYGPAISILTSLTTLLVVIIGF